ncbi:MAG: peroxiredoxin [Steroidobacteraceae bacterium]
MANLAVGSKLPTFTAASTGSGTWSSSAARPGKLLLYFYPKDDTSGCTMQAEQFRDLYPKLRRVGVTVLGISRDSLLKHEKFKAKYELPFELLADEDESLCKLFDVIHEKSLYGRKYMGIVRSSFLFDGKGVLQQEWRKVKVDGHAEVVLEAAKRID